MTRRRFTPTQSFLADVARVDIFGVKTGGAVDGELHAPLRPVVPALRAGASYLLDTVVRTLKVGHPFSQGTADSNEIWLEVSVTSGGRVIARSGALEDGAVDPHAHFISVYMLDRQGRRVDRRNVQDIFVPLYDHQIPPSAAAVVHYGLDVPARHHRADRGRGEAAVPQVHARLHHATRSAPAAPELPITTIASDRITFPVDRRRRWRPSRCASRVNAWERWNDYGIGLLLEGTTGQRERRASTGRRRVRRGRTPGTRRTVR